ncbi:WD40 repeat-like protein [Punctularia strigosozonata HHB-11173 SS5]|uniref:WD40 repeat-like protein n=1 Tax=Punctularia strigosozonata (strain HHB-11173) TaxID=741275 RepID=UPI0004416BB5|nr:WD40 repeat-like protein [Punctularia strigosozonata HHB-11173 SS5]EIN07690.1 WD40 repeat-like protein [Punctularia strigosozonata HHB-11173 SS5]
MPEAPRRLMIDQIVVTKVVVTTSDIRAPLTLLLRGHTEAVVALANLPDGLRIASGSMDGTIRLWDTSMGRSVLEPLRGHTLRVRSVVFSQDGKCLASGSSDRTICICYAETGKQFGAPLQGHKDYVLCMAFSPNGG